ncbi:hypothetical protein [Roseinatronobacter alkalisoli]|uniref:Restriction endonuclease n=1 Tax=Roseinatronobacter alkalisoli TaxID=3028235 RepID=A0ABT5TE04_9RHOB|nr:hypothetical protein [Roseinatronobacter sp. HJB301]MDD7973189.1 hypothetical protein [Roseinatronobacter sp. HJB301]
MKFSEIFGIGLEQPQLDFVDITPDSDMPLFIDPFAISLKGDAWSELCHQHINHFFQTALDHIRAGRDDSARAMLNGLREPNETCLGLSQGAPAGRGVGGRQAFDLYESLAASQAAQSGLLEELAECDLFVPGIGSDKISDITTNIIRHPLIKYTQEQCALHDIDLQGDYPSGRYWDIDAGAWRHDYVRLPVVAQKRLILVPKYTVRRKMALTSQEFYSQHILNFIQEEEMQRGSPLVRVLRDGTRRPPTKKSLKERFPFSKDFVARFSEEHPEVLNRYKRLYAELEGAQGTLRHEDFDDEFDEVLLAQALAETLLSIPPGNANADRYHKFIMGALEFIFWPNLICPKKEQEIHEGRKRIDIIYTNAAQSGFFWRAHTAHNIASRMIMVECKNYSKDLANPELDQLSGRFAVNRGQLGMLLYRTVENYGRLCARCRDAAQDGRGFMLALGDEQVTEFLNLIADGQRAAIDARLQAMFNELIA